MSAAITAFPLTWPPGKPRTASRKPSAFKTHFDGTRGMLEYELKRLGASDLIVSSNLPLRGIERWGSGDMVQQAFTGFAQLAAPDTVQYDPWEVLGLSGSCSLLQVEAAFRKKAIEHHPDRGGDPTEFQKLVIARDLLRKRLTS